MKVREQRKHRVSDKSSRELSSELLKYISTAINMVKEAPNKENNVTIIHMTSV